MSKRPCSSQASKSEIKIKRQKRSNSSPSNEVSADDKVVLNVLLNCEETKSSETKQVHFQSLPTTPLKIKKKIEEDFSIPSCVQTLHYQSMTMKDSDQLQQTHFRSGDRFTVDYPIEGECEMVQNVIKWLKEIFELLQSVELVDFQTSSHLQKIENLILQRDRNDDRLTSTLSDTLFFPWKDKIKLINCFYFQQEGGLDALMNVYGILVSKEWGELGIDSELQISLEYSCSLAICNYGHTFPLRRQVIQLGGLEICTKSLLRKRLIQEEYTSNMLVYDTLFSALLALCR